VAHFCPERRFTKEEACDRSVSGQAIEFQVGNADQPANTGLNLTVRPVTVLALDWFRSMARARPAQVSGPEAALAETPGPRQNDPQVKPTLDGLTVEAGHFIFRLCR
jgi:hypothetical protein